MSPAAEKFSKNPDDRVFKASKLAFEAWEAGITIRKKSLEIPRLTGSLDIFTEGRPCPRRPSYSFVRQAGNFPRENERYLGRCEKMDLCEMTCRQVEERKIRSDRLKHWHFEDMNE
ncbi:hypothetical protein N7520_010281 [Penicillium odoratum]|uniref:uncharacterized protein n=1 Tax=Penicillium odoratum TaxID=1167516 RepID=UPI002547AF49|nr:uncharacterized protein N7520_010281 [Penicillium odoratum]KAJ5745099.1 hypothetical protein N7520_010281 [Penicillium odoratum]